MSKQFYRHIAKAIELKKKHAQEKNHSVEIGEPRPLFSSSSQVNTLINEKTGSLSLGVPYADEPNLLPALTPVTALKEHLQDYYQNKQILNLHPLIGDKDIFSYLVEQIEQSDDLPSLHDCLAILELAKKIKRHLTHPYKNDYFYLTQLLSTYYHKINFLLADLSLKQGAWLKDFFNTFFQHEKITHLRNASKSINPFSHQPKVKEQIALLDECYKTFNQQYTQLQRYHSQRAYSQLLQNILEEKPLSSIFSSDLQSKKSENSLLSEDEFIFLDEPDNPERIGFNKTMTFVSTSDKKISKLFATFDLQQEFLNNFSWGVDTDFIKKRSPLTINSPLNLLALELLLPPSLQLAAIKYVLLSLDFIGKAAGFNGELAIYNFEVIQNQVNELVNTIQALNDPLQAFDPLFEQKLNRLIDALHAQNQQFYVLSLQSSQAQANPFMNGFCHLNEQLGHKLTGIAYKASILTPDKPDEPYSKALPQLDQWLKAKPNFLK